MGNALGLDPLAERSFYIKLYKPAAEKRNLIKKQTKEKLMELLSDTERLDLSRRRLEARVILEKAIGEGGASGSLGSLDVGSVRTEELGAAIVIVRLAKVPWSSRTLSQRDSCKRR